jgi:hypothetical protein
MATRTIGTNRRSRTKFVRIFVVLAIAASALTVQANSLLSTTLNTAAQPLPVTRLNELPTGPQHNHGPHPYKMNDLALPPASGRVH